MYHFGSRIRYSELACSGDLSVFSLLNYFQDCSTFQSEALGLGVEVLKARKRVWVLSSWHVEIARMPRLGENVRIETFATAFNGFSGNRNFVMYDEKDQVLACADTLWVLVDLERNRPMKATAEDVAPYGLYEAMPMPVYPRKIPLGENAEKLAPITVTDNHLDTNLHVNNTQYVAMAMAFIGNRKKVRTLRVEYKKSALLGDVIYPSVSVEKERIVVELNDADGHVYAIIEMQ